MHILHICQEFLKFAKEPFYGAGECKREQGISYVSSRWLALPSVPLRFRAFGCDAQKKKESCFWAVLGVSKCFFFCKCSSLFYFCGVLCFLTWNSTVQAKASLRKAFRAFPCVSVGLPHVFRSFSRVSRRCLTFLRFVAVPSVSSCFFCNGRQGCGFFQSEVAEKGASRLGQTRKSTTGTRSPWHLKHADQGHWRCRKNWRHRAGTRYWARQE